MPFPLSVGEESLVLLRGNAVKFSLAGCLIGYNALPFLDPLLGLSLGVLPSIVKLIQLKSIFRDSNHKFLFSIDQLYQTSDQFASLNMEDIYFLIVVDAIILQIYQIFHLIFNAIELVFVYFFVGNEEMAQDFVVVRGILAVLLEHCEDFMHVFTVYDVFEGNALLWTLVDLQYFG